MRDKTWEDWHEQFKDDMRDYERAETDWARNVALMCAASALSNLEVAINNMLDLTT